MKRYEITGRTNSPLDDGVISGHAVGEVVEGDLDENIERQLIGAGALRVLPDEPKAQTTPTETTERSKRAVRKQTP